MNTQTLYSPEELLRVLCCPAETADLIARCRDAIRQILSGADTRLLVVVGPCSIHDPNSALDYAARLLQQRTRFSKTLEIVMRVYLEKPRTIIGWKGLINDPDLDASHRIDLGLHLARELLLKINALGMPAATEFLNIVSAPYIADLISWGSIGARTVESPLHRELASSLVFPIGFKNSTDGNVQIAINAALAAAYPHRFISIAPNGQIAMVSSAGNPDSHLILRGGKTPNYDRLSVAAVKQQMQNSGLAQRLMIDASHANNQNKHQANQQECERQRVYQQLQVIEVIAEQISAGETAIIGVMLESYLVAGRQSRVLGKPLVYGQSITDACIGWEETEQVLVCLADAVEKRLCLGSVSKSKIT